MIELMESVPFAILATGVFVGLASTLVGTFLVLRQDSMLSDATSHGVVFGIAATWLLTRQASGPAQLVGAALAGLLTVLLSEWLARTGRVKDDTSIGLVFPFLFAVGVLILNVYAGDVHVDAHTVLLGEIGFVWLDTLPVLGVALPRALLTMAAVFAIDLAFVVALYKELKLVTFDPVLARAAGFRPGLLSTALLALLSLTAVAAFDAVGAVLFVAFVVVPPATAWLLTNRLAWMIAVGASVSVTSVTLGYLAAVAADVSIGGMMALATAPFLILAFLFGPEHGLLARAVRSRGRRRLHESRALAVHLYRHENDPSASEEGSVAALRDHLHFEETQARRVLVDALDAGWVERRGDRLELTPRGRALAREVLEPWRAAEDAAGPRRAGA